MSSPMTIGIRIGFAIFFLSAVESSFNVGILAYLINSTGSLASANYLQSIFWLSMTVAELPTGYLSDRWGPKVSLLLAIALRIMAFSIFFFFGQSSLVALIVANLIAGIAVTFLTGVFSAQLRLVERCQGLTINYVQFTAMSSCFRYLGMIAGSGVGYLTLRFGSIADIWVGAGGLAVIHFFYVLSSWENVQGEIRSSSLGHLQKAWDQIRNRPALRKAIIFNALLTCLTLSFFSNWIVVYVPELNKTPALLTMSLVLLSLLRSVVSYFYGRLWVARVLLFETVAIAGAAMLVASANHLTLSICGFTLAVTAFTWCELLLKQSILENLPPDEAGVVSSLQSLIENIAGSVGFVLLGAFLSHYSVQDSWRLSGIAMVLMAMFGLFIKIRGRSHIQPLIKSNPSACVKSSPVFHTTPTGS